MFLWYKYLIVTLVFSHLGFWSGNLSLSAPFLDLCLLVPFFDTLTPPIYALQGGFQKNFGCLMTSFLLHESIFYAKENGSKLYVS